MKLRFALTFAVAFTLELGLLIPASAQTASAITTTAATDTKRDLAAKLVALQRGPEMERMTLQLTTGAIQPLIAKWGPKLETMPVAKQEKARDQLNAELKLLGDSIRKMLEDQMNKSAETSLLPAYMERFSEEEMRQLVTLFEAPAFKKYQSVSPELGDIWIKDVMDSARATVVEKEAVFDTTAAKIIGTESVDKKPVAKKK